jgi:hypothetical protein
MSAIKGWRSFKVASWDPCRVLKVNKATNKTISFLSFYIYLFCPFCLRPSPSCNIQWQLSKKKMATRKSLKLNTSLSFCHLDGSWAARHVLSHKRVFKTNEPIGIVVRLCEGHLSCWRLDTAWGNTRWGAGPINLPWLAGNCIFVMSIRCESTWIKAKWGPDWWRSPQMTAPSPVIII